MSCDWQPGNIDIRIGETYRKGDSLSNHPEGTVPVAVGSIFGDVPGGAIFVESNRRLRPGDDAHSGIADRLIEGERFGETVIVTSAAARSRAVEQTVAFGERVAAV